MEIYEIVNDVLNDLVMVNDDRIARYEKEIDDVRDIDIALKAIFRGMIEQSKIHRACVDIKSLGAENDRYTILADCEFGEDATQRAYDAIISSGKLQDEQARKMVEGAKCPEKIARNDNVPKRCLQTISRK